MAGGAGHHVHAEPAALEREQGVDRHGQHVVGPLGGDVDIHRGLIEGGPGRGAVQGDGDRHRRGGVGAASAGRAGRLVGRAPAGGGAAAAAARAGGHVADGLDPCPPTVVVPSGRTTDTASPGFSRYSWVTSRSTVTMGVVLVAVRTVPPPPLAAARRHRPPAERADRGRDRGDPDGAGLEDHLAEQDLAGCGQAEGGLPTLRPRWPWRMSSGCFGSARRRNPVRSGPGSTLPHRRRRTCPT